MDEACDLESLEWRLSEEIGSVEKIPQKFKHRNETWWNQCLRFCITRYLYIFAEGYRCQFSHRGHRALMGRLQAEMILGGALSDPETFRVWNIGRLDVNKLNSVGCYMIYVHNVWTIFWTPWINKYKWYCVYINGQSYTNIVVICSDVLFQDNQRWNYHCWSKRHTEWILVEALKMDRARNSLGHVSRCVYTSPSVPIKPGKKLAWGQPQWGRQAGSILRLRWFSRTQNRQDFKHCHCRGRLAWDKQAPPQQAQLREGQRSVLKWEQVTPRTKPQPEPAWNQPL